MITGRRMSNGKPRSLFDSLSDIQGKELMVESKKLTSLIGGLTVVTIAVTAIFAQQPQRQSPVDANVLKNAGGPNDALAGSWLSYGRSQGETRFSPLKQLNTSNVGRLGLSWI